MMLKTSEVLIEVKRYSVNQQPICSYDIHNGCDYLLTSRFGTKFSCGLCGNEELHREGKYKTGYLIPHKNCPLWNNWYEKR